MCASIGFTNVRPKEFLCNLSGKVLTIDQCLMLVGGFAVIRQWQRGDCSAVVSQYNFYVIRIGEVHASNPLVAQYRTFNAFIVVFGSRYGANEYIECSCMALNAERSMLLVWVVESLISCGSWALQFCRLYCSVCI